MRRLCVLLLMLAACGGDDDGDDSARPDASGDPDDPDAGEGDLGCTLARQHARFRVSSTAEYGNVHGAWDDRPFPVPDEPEHEAGGCFFVGPGAYSYFCDPACVGATFCGPDNTCLPLPMTIPVGTVHITGTDPELDLEPQPGNSYYTTENYPGLVQPGDLITVSGGGGDSGVEPFEISARAVPELTVPWETATATEHEDMVVTWDVADSSPEGAQIVLHMDSDHHGTRAFVECWSDDSGQLVVPAAVLDPLILAGETGIGTYIENAYMLRLHRGTLDTDDGCAVLDGEFNLNITVETVRAE